MLVTPLPRDKSAKQKIFFNTVIICVSYHNFQSSSNLSSYVYVSMYRETSLLIIMDHAYFTEKTKNKNFA